MKKNKQKKEMPDFDKMTKEEEASWWENHDTSNYLDQFDEVEVKFGSGALKSPPKQTRGLHVRLDPITFGKLRAAARGKGLGATSLARMWIMERLQEIGDSYKFTKSR